MLKSILSLLIATLSLCFTCSPSDAYFSPYCSEEHKNLTISDLQRIAEDSSAPLHERMEAILCLSEFGADAVRILYPLLDSAWGDYNVVNSTLEALRRIRERRTIPSLLKFIDKIDANLDNGSPSSVPLYDQMIKLHTVDILIVLAMTAFDEPYEPPPPLVVHSDGSVSCGIIELDPIICGGPSSLRGFIVPFGSMGTRPRQSDAMKVINFLKKVKARQYPGMTQEEIAKEESIVKLASDGLNALEKRIGLLEQHGPKPVQVDARTVDRTTKTTLHLRNAVGTITDVYRFQDARCSLEFYNTHTDAALSLDSVNSLKTVLNNPSDVIRWRAIVLLGLSRNPSAIAAISNSLQSDPSLKVRSQAAKSLERPTED